MAQINSDLKEGVDCYDNQILFCKKNKLPLFAYRQCFSCKVKLNDYLIEKRGLEEALLYSASTLITGCPKCGQTWCD